MMNKLEMNDDVKEFLNTDDKHVWDFILNDKIDDLLAVLPRKNDSVLDKIIIELFSKEKEDTLLSHDFVTIKESNSALLNDLVRFIFSLNINGKYQEIQDKVADRLIEVIPAIVDNIQSLSSGYPGRPVNALVWMEGAGMRTALNNLIYYYRHAQDIDMEHFAVVMRTKITLAIMGHYKNMVGPDMIESAKIKEKIGETETALAFYDAVKSDLGEELDWFAETPEAAPNPDDAIILQSLQEAYRSLDRLNNTNLYTEQCSLIDEILTREYIEMFDEDEDESEDE